jgi:hypothetical protein
MILKSFCREFRSAIPEEVIASNILHAVISTAAIASDIGRGLAIIIGVKDADARELLEKCLKGYKAIDETDGYDELREQRPCTKLSRAITLSW